MAGGTQTPLKSGLDLLEARFEPEKTLVRKILFSQPNWGVLDELYELFEQSRCPVRCLLCCVIFRINGTREGVVGSEGLEPPTSCL
jgi:hypothetical protein